MNEQLQKNLNALGKNNQGKYKALREQAIISGVQFYKAIKQVEEWKLTITDEQRKALKWLLGDMLDLVPLNYKHAYLIKNLGDPDTLETLNLRQFNFFQDLMSKIEVRGRENAIKLYDSVHTFEGVMQDVSILQKQQQEAAKIFGVHNTEYAKFCNDKHIMPEDLDAIVEEMVNGKAETDSETESKSAK